jgi:hypothetical protein
MVGGRAAGRFLEIGGLFESCYFRGSIEKGFLMAGQGSTGNVIAALASFFIPGLGQLLQGRFLMALIQFVLAAVLWIVLLGWIIHLWSILDAALFKPKAEKSP